MADLVKEFFDFVKERQNIWYKRFILKQKRPWTEDKTLQTYKIINVYRELDKGTSYIIDKLKGVSDRETILLNVVFYRFFNQHKWYEKLGIPIIKRIDKKELASVFRKLRNRGLNLFNTAYLIAPAKKGQEKHISVLEILERVNFEEIVKKIDDAKSPEESFLAIQNIQSVGPFLAYEIWTDLTYFDFFNQHWSDDDFVNIGPGAKWGLEIIFGQRLNKKSQIEKINYLHKKQRDFLDNKLWKKIAYKKTYSNYPFLSLRNIEHALCEFRKYWRLKQGKGRKKYFNPSSQS